MRRNRIQAGLCYATVPVEAKGHSGTAHTYRFARAFNRVTFGIVNKNYPENGIVELMRRDGQPIFTIEDAASMHQLEELLGAALPESPPRRDTSKFQGLLREFERIISAYPVTKGEIDTLKTELTQRWENHTRGGQGGGARS